MQHQKRKRTIIRKRKASKSSRRSEANHYQPDSPLTKYVEKVCGVNCTDPDKA